MKKILIFVLLLPSLLWGKEVRFNCDFFLSEYNGKELKKPSNNLKLFNIPYLLSNDTNLEILDFNLSLNFITNLNNISIILGRNDEFGSLLADMNNNFKDYDVSDVNQVFKKWLVPQFKYYSEISLQNNSIVVTTILENGVVLVTDGTLSKINNSLKGRNTILFLIQLDGADILFESECR